MLSLQLDRDTPGDGLGPLVPVFCIEVNVLVRGGDRYKSDGPVTALHGGCQIRYLLDRYPASTATTADEAAARQLAIWHFSDDIDLTTVQEPAIQARAITLADEAALAVALGGCPGSQTSIASLTLDPPTASVVTGQVVNYTVRADPPGAAQSVDITISGSATLQNGQQQATLPLIQGVATFSVINPVAGTSTITARLPYVLDAGTVFSPINAGRPNPAPGHGRSHQPERQRNRSGHLGAGDCDADSHSTHCNAAHRQFADGNATHRWYADSNATTDRCCTPTATPPFDRWYADRDTSRTPAQRQATLRHHQRRQQRKPSSGPKPSPLDAPKYA